MKNVLLLGGSGFIGRRVAHHLSRRGMEVRVPVRDRERAKQNLILLPTIDMRVADIHDTATLEGLLQDVDIVINCVGVLHDTHHAFQRNHIDLPSKLVQLCQRVGPKRLLHVSALHASPAGPSRYMRSKGEGERIVGAAADLATTMFCPSVVFGPGDSFLTLFAQMARLSPIMPLGGASARFAPVYVDDVARAMVMSLDLADTIGQRYDLCGPRMYTLRELVAYAAHLVHKDPIIIGLPDALARLQALVLEYLPGRLITRDNLDSMTVDSVSTAPFPSVFGFAPTPLEAIAPHYLGDVTSRARYDVFRARR